MKYFISYIFISLSLCSFGQKGKPIYLPIDTLKGADTVYLSMPAELTGYYSLSWEVYFQQIGGTSDGVGILQTANDTIYSTVNSVDGAVTASPNDSIIIADGVQYTYWLYGTPANKYRIRLIGTEDDTTRVISNYILKQ